MPVPMHRAVQPQVDIVGGPYKFVWEPRPAAGAEDCAGPTKRGVHCLVPPTGVADSTTLRLAGSSWLRIAVSRAFV